MESAEQLISHLSDNEFPELLGIVHKYCASLTRNTAQKIDWIDVWGLGVRLQNAAYAANRDVTLRTLPPLEDPAAAALDSLLEIHAPLILATKVGVELTDKSTNFYMTRRQQLAFGELAKVFAERLNADGLQITEAVSEALDDAIDAIGREPNPERGTVYGVVTITNLFVVVIGAAAVATPAVVGALMGNAILGTAVGAPIALVVVKAIKKNPAFTALVTQLGGKLEEMSSLDLRVWLNQKATLLAPIRDFVRKNKQLLRNLIGSLEILGRAAKYLSLITDVSFEERDQSVAKLPNDELEILDLLLVHGHIVDYRGREFYWVDGSDGRALHTEKNETEIRGALNRLRARRPALITTAKIDDALPDHGPPGDTVDAYVLTEIGKEVALQQPPFG